MIAKDITFRASDGKDLFGYKWESETAAGSKAVVQIIHGMAETAIRYERFAKKLTENGYVVYAYDQRGHGKTAGSLDEVGYIADVNSLELLVEDQHAITESIRKENSGLPIFLFGHSMGSFVTQSYIQLYGKDISGAVLSGSNGKTGLLLHIGKILASGEIKKVGRKVRSPKLNKLSFGTYNNVFKPNRTEFDWLSRDNAEVDSYIQDPYCGGIFSAGFYLDLINFLKQIQLKANITKVPVMLPLLLVSGDKDPVGGAGKGVQNLHNSYQKIGIKDLTCKLYKDARHEILNETNREEVMADIINWLNHRVAK